MPYVSLTTDQVDLLTQLYQNRPHHPKPQPAHALLRSQRNDSIPDLAHLSEVDLDTIGRWMERWQDLAGPDPTRPERTRDQPAVDPPPT